MNNIAPTDVTNAPRTLLYCSGEGALAFLDKLVSQDLQDMKAGEARYTLLLNPQGRYLYDFFVIAAAAPGEAYIDVATQQVESLLATLAKYRMRLPVTFGPAAGDTRLRYADSRHANLGERVWGDGNIGPRRGESDTPELTLIEGYSDVLTRLCIVEPSLEMTSGQDLPLEFGLQFANAISFAKGCFMGQELTARTHNRNLIKHAVFCMPTTAPPLAGETLIDNAGKVVGRVIRRAGEHILVQANIDWARAAGYISASDGAHSAS